MKKNTRKPVYKPLLCMAIVLLAKVSTAQPRSYAGGSDFQFGFARVLQNSAGTAGGATGHYIDTSGQVAFDQILKGDFISDTDTEIPGDSTLLPAYYFVVVEKQGKLGVLNSNGTWILKPLYDSIDTRYSNEWIVKKDGRQSIYTKKGFLLPFRFGQVWNMDGNYFNVTQNGKWGVYSKKEDKLVIPCIYEDMDYCYGCQFKGDYVFAKKGGKWGIIDLHNKILVSFKYEHHHLNMTSGNRVYALYLNDTPLDINLTTGQVDSCRCDPAGSSDSTGLAGGFIRVEKNDKYGLLNSAGKQVLDYKYNFIRYDADTMGIYLPAPYVQFSTAEGWGVADTTGKVIIPPAYENVRFLGRAGMFICGRTATDTYREVLLDKNGNRVLPGSYSNIQPDSTDDMTDHPPVHYLVLEKDSLFGLYNPATKAIRQPEYNKISKYQFNTQFAHSIEITKNALTGIIDVNTAQETIAPQFDRLETGHLPEGLAIVGKQKNNALYDYQKQKLVIPYRDVRLFLSENHQLLKLSDGQHYGLEDFNGKIRVPVRYTEIHALNDSLYLLSITDSNDQQHYQFYNSQNPDPATCLYAAPADTVEGVYSDSAAIIVKDRHFMLWNPSTRQIIGGAYRRGGYPDSIGIFLHNVAGFIKNGKAGALAPSGALVTAPVYDGISDFKDGYALMLKGRDSLGNYLYGFLDTAGKEVLPPRYSLDPVRYLSDYLEDSTFLLLKPGPDGSYLTGLADFKGRQLVAPAYDKIIPQNSGRYYIVQRRKLFGITDSLGHMILPTRFEDIGLYAWPAYNSPYRFDFPVAAKKEGTWRYYKKDGTSLPVTFHEHIPFTKSLFE